MRMRPALNIQYRHYPSETKGLRESKGQITKIACKS